MKTTISKIENKITGTVITHVRKSNGVVAVNVQSEWYDNDEIYQKKHLSFVDQALCQLFKNIRNESNG